nr:hypothetical protein [Burkholderia pyrrocinia]
MAMFEAGKATVAPDRFFGALKQEENSILGSVRAAWLAPMLADGFVAPPFASFAAPPRPAAMPAPAHAAGLQYDTAHVSVAPDDFARFTDSFVATFRGSKPTQGVVQVTPMPSQALARLIFMPFGTIPVFEFKTPIPRPFGSERTG